ncbi:Putative papain-like cysteine peptidase [Hyphomicrobium facile]|uniref:Putative papain-like cysteine peptidase n=2 Tax=Hyphomicrobium facile TaxID=51670 RepID=A0A1I7NTU8_9HYPH|nr:Putative papain-like cysteine peptidase [Hyphomicrobium facile]
MRKTFHQAVSLGNSCQVIYQLREHLGAEFCSSGVFDMQVTPPSALIEYLQRDFREMFERADLSEENGIVFNRRFLTEHLHEFPNGLERSYEDARSRHDYLCQKLRSVIDGRTPTLFALRHCPSVIDLDQRVRSILRERNRRLPFKIVTVHIGSKPTRPHPNDWEGNDDEWANRLSPFRVCHPWESRARKQAKRFMGHVMRAKF